LAGFLRFWLPPIIYAVVIFLLSSISKPQISFQFESNLFHYPEYAIFSYLLIRAFHAGKREVVSVPNILYAFLISLFFGLFDEFHQAFVPQRVPELQDLFRDGIGTLAGIVIFTLYTFFHYHKRERKLQCKS